MAAWVYPIVVHSVWSTAGWANMNRVRRRETARGRRGRGGAGRARRPRRLPLSPLQANGPLLFQRGAIDFAGSGAVHMVGGFAAAAGALVVGPRIGRFLPDGTVVSMPGHNSSLFILGVMILWFGW